MIRNQLTVDGCNKRESHSVTAECGKGKALAMTMEGPHGKLMLTNTTKRTLTNSTIDVQRSLRLEAGSAYNAHADLLHTEQVDDGVLNLRRRDNNRHKRVTQITNNTSTTNNENN